MLRLYVALSLVALAAPAAAADRSELRPGPAGREPAPSSDAPAAGSRGGSPGPAPARANLSACLEGTYRPACRPDLLTPPQRERLRKAEARQNVLLCLAGSYAEACHHELLSPAESRAVAEAEARAASRRTGSRPAATAAGAGRSPVDPYVTPGSPLAPGALDGYAIGAPVPRDPRAGTSLAKPIPDGVRGPDVGPRWPGGATDPAAMYGTPFRRDAGASPYAAGGRLVLP